MANQIPNDTRNILFSHKMNQLNGKTCGNFAHLLKMNHYKMNKTKQ